jgi:mRNA interferase MazF
MPRPIPRRGELWWFDPDPVVGRELGRKVRPCLVVSVDEVNEGRSEKVIVVPGSSVDHRIPSHVRFDYQRDGRPVTTFFCCEDVRAISVDRLLNRMAPKPIPSLVLGNIEDWLRSLMGL